MVPARVNGTEKAILEAAAARNGLALSTFLVQAGLDAAEHRGSGTALQRETLLALIRAAGQVRKVGVNLNQAVAKLNATGQPGPDLEPSAAYCMRVVRQVSETAMLVRRRLQ